MFSRNVTAGILPGSASSLRNKKKGRSGLKWLEMLNSRSQPFSPCSRPRIIDSGLINYHTALHPDGFQKNFSLYPYAVQETLRGCINPMRIREMSIQIGTFINQI